MLDQPKRRLGSKILLAVVGLSTGALCASAARASMSINLVFPNGTNSMALTPANAGQDFPILVYGTVTGAKPVTLTQGATTGNFDGIDFAYYSITSSRGSNGGLAGNIDNGAANPTYAPALSRVFAANSAQAGHVADLNGDGIADLGSNSNSNLAAFAISGGFFDDDGVSPEVIVGGSDRIR